MLMRKKQLKDELPLIWQDLKIESYPELSSTNEHAKKQLRKNKDQEILILTDKQTAGRGRNGRSFYSKLDHGLYFSIGIKVKEMDPKDLTLYTIAAATAMAQTIEKELGLRLQIKWVNDLFYQGRKIAGILTESIIHGKTNQINSLVIGIGLNLAGTFSEADELTQATAGTLFEELPVDFDLESFILLFLIYFGSYHEKIQAREFIPLYEERLLGVDKAIYYFKKEKKYHAWIKGINNDGHLLVENKQGKLETLFANEIHFSSRQFIKE